jgi:hypothetical protein
VPRAVKAGILLFDSVANASAAVVAFLHADLPSLARYGLVVFAWRRTRRRRRRRTRLTLV